MSTVSTDPIGPLIGIEPRGQVRWSGTAAQLIAEGIVSPDFDWSKVGGRMTWSDDRFTYWALWHRPSWMSGAEWKASSKDYGTVQVRLPEVHGTGFSAAREYALQQELKEHRFRESPEGAKQFHRWYEANGDATFQAFLLRAGAKKQKASRRRKAGERQAHGDENRHA
jgi:hypothetical protein